jgi:hypothetical protein
MKTECWCAFSISALMLTSCGSVTGDAPAVTGDAPAASALPTPSIHQCDDAPSLIIESVGPEYDSIEVLTAASDIVVKVQGFAMTSASSTAKGRRFRTRSQELRYWRRSAVHRSPHRHS